MHVHRATPSRTREYGWTHCATPDACAAHPHRKDAHGGIVRIDICACGAIRETEINGSARNVGPWVEKNSAHSMRSNGGKARMAALTAERRAEIARKAAAARWWQKEQA